MIVRRLTWPQRHLTLSLSLCFNPLSQPCTVPSCGANPGRSFVAETISNDRVMGSELPTFFPTPADFRAWLKKNHKKEAMLWVGYYKKATGKPSVTWEETVDEALCYGWIDGVRRSFNDESYVIRFTPRKPKSVWSGRNIERVEALKARGRMRKAGLDAYAHKDLHADSGYAVGDRPEALPKEMIAEFKKYPEAWALRRPGHLKRESGT